MGKQNILNRLATFKSNLNALKSTNILKYEDVKNKTQIMTEEIESYEHNYTNDQDVYLKFDKNLIFCEALISYYDSLKSNYFNHWVGGYSIKGL